MADPIVGIDLGTSNCSVAVVDARGKATVLADGKGRTVVPSIVSFHPSGEVLIGADAKHRRQNDPRNTIFSIKRMIGRPYSAKEIAEAKLRSPFAIYKGEREQPLVVTRAGKFTPEEISAVILDHMRGIAERALGVKVERAVITVPANFNEAQRKATAAAAQIAGLVPVRLLNEPTAAAVAYGHGRANRQHVAVYDFGGGTFDVSILKLVDNVYEVLATAGDTFLGGDDIDERLVEHQVGQFLAKHRVDLRTDPMVIERLRATVEQVKCELSVKTRAVVTAEGVAAGAGGAPLDLTAALTRDELVGLIKDIVDRSFPVVEDALRAAGLGRQQIDEIILVGGTTRIPYVRERVAKFFGKTPRVDMDPEQAVALGAAIHAAGIQAMLDRRAAGPGAGPPGIALPLPAPAPGPGPVPAPPAAGRATLLGPAAAPVALDTAPLLDDSDVLEEVTRDARGDDEPTGVRAPTAPPVAAAPVIPPPVLMEVTPRALSIATVGGLCEMLLQRGVRIPCEKSREFTTARDDQEVVEIQVLGGESRRMEDNLPLGLLVLEGLPRRKRAEVKITVTFVVSEDGTLEVRAMDRASGRSQAARIELSGALSPEATAAARERFQAARAGS